MRESIAQDDATEAALQNWARWCRSGHGGPGQCLSAEGRYRRVRIPGDTPTGWGDYLVTAPEAYEGPIDILGALEVERVMRFLPAKHKTALQLHYIYRLPPRMICRRLGLGYRKLEAFLIVAALMVQNRLTSAKPLRTISTNLGSHRDNARPGA
jgi:hypothetical protein